MKKFISILLISFISLSIIAQKSNYEIIQSLKSYYHSSDINFGNVVIKFNEDTILIADNHTKTILKDDNIVYKTSNGGKDWKAIKFNGDSWIYTATHFEDGHIWMGGSDEYIHYSKDYGETWERLNKPFIPNTRILSIFMKNDTIGIVGGHSNGLAITYDNWKTTTQIPTPLEQGKYKIIKNSSRDRVENIALLDSIILIDQNNYIYCSKINSINWKEFNVPVRDFLVKNDNKEVHLQSRHKVYVLNQNLNLLSTYLVDNNFCEMPFEKQNINISKFFDSKIKSVVVKSISFTPIENSLIAQDKRNEKIAYLKKKRNEKIILNNSFDIDIAFKDDVFKAIFENDKYKSLNKSKDYFNFTVVDINNFKEFLSQKIKNYKERENYGDNSSFVINPELLSKIETNNIKSSFNNIDIENLFSYNNYTCFDLFNQSKNYFEIIIKNGDNEKIFINNKSSIFFSLPWEITYNGEKLYCYNPELTFLLRDIIFSINIPNKDLLLGGELIYEVLEKDLFNNTEYINPLR